MHFFWQSYVQEGNYSLKNNFREIEKEVINWYSKPHDNYECAESSLAVSSKLDRKCCLNTFSSFRQWKHIRLFCDSTSNKPTTCFALLDVSWRGQMYKNNTIAANYNWNRQELFIIINPLITCKVFKTFKIPYVMFYPRCWFVISTNHTQITLFQNWNYNITLASKLEYIKGVEQNWQHCT